MVSKKLTEFFTKLKISRKMPEIRKEIKILYDLGVNMRELEYLVKIKENEKIVINGS